jgi:hypothetical protein
MRRVNVAVTRTRMVLVIIGIVAGLASKRPWNGVRKHILSSELLVEGDMGHLPQTLINDAQTSRQSNERGTA